MLTKKQDAAERQRRRAARVKAERAGVDPPGWARLRQPGRNATKPPRIQTPDDASAWELDQALRQSIKSCLAKGLHPQPLSKALRDLALTNAAHYISRPEFERAMEAFCYATIAVILRWTHPAHIKDALTVLEESWRSPDYSYPEQLIPTEGINFTFTCDKCKTTTSKVPDDPVDKLVEAVQAHVHTSRHEQVRTAIRQCLGSI